MDATAALQAIANSLPQLSMESVESMFVTFDTLVGLSPAEARPGAVHLLRDAAGAASNEGLRERLREAADAVEAGRPCARTPEGLTWHEAASASTVSAGEWKEPPLPETVEDEESGDDEEPELAGEPPKLPPLPVQHFFPGLVVRVARELTDTRGRALVPGRVLRLLKSEAGEEGVYSLSFLEANLRVTDEAVLLNAGNQWFQPVPSVDCLTELWELLNEHLDDAEDLDDEGEERLERIVDEVGQCEDWLLDDENSGPPPRCKSGPLAARVFGRSSGMAVWLPLLFAGLAAASREE